MNGPMNPAFDSPNIAVFPRQEEEADKFMGFRMDSNGRFTLLENGLNDIERLAMFAHMAKVAARESNRLSDKLENLLAG